MNQNFPLMKDLIPLLFERKTITNRALIKSKKTGEFFRRKCNVGDLMFFWDNYRMKGMKIVGIGIILEVNEWNISEIPKNIEDSKKLESPKKNLNWFKFSWIDGFTYYNRNHMALKLNLKKKELEVQLETQFKRETGKNAIWCGKETKGFIQWRSFFNFVDYFSYHKKKVDDFKMFYFRKARKEEIPINILNLFD